jgi:hypothetical protein
MPPLASPWLLVGGLAANGGCTVFDGLAAAGAPEGGTGPADGVESGAARPPEAPKPSADGGAPNPATGTSYCAQEAARATFCADFDGADPFAGWSARDEAGGSLTRAEESAVSAPFALASRLTGGPTGAQARALVMLPLSTPSLRVGLDVRFGPCEASNADAVSIVSLAVGTGYILDLVRTGGTLLLREQASFGGTSVSGATGFGASPAEGQWTRLELSVLLAGPGRAGVVTGSVGARTEGPVPLDAAPPAASSLTLAVGAGTAAANAGCELLVDNVRYDAVTP